MGTVIVTGSGGLVGAEAARQFALSGRVVAGVDNDMRAYFFGPEASTGGAVERLREECPAYRHHHADIRDQNAMERVFLEHRGGIEAVVHAAAQPSHDWAAREPLTDFGVNATGTLNLLELTRRHAPEAVFIFTSTNKVYGDTPNRLPLVELDDRWEVDPGHPCAAHGIDESMSIDRTRHSLFGASKVAADIMVQEYGRHFGMPTVVFRGGCLTGPGHNGVELHGFLAYLMKCAVTGTRYRIFGHRGKQVRDNIHAADLARCFLEVARDPRPGEVYNIGGGRASNCSMREAVALCGEIAGRPMDTVYVEEARAGDHVWWISDTRRFEAHYPGWRRTHNIRSILEEIYVGLQSRK